tara:strand:+ start:2882 stop:5056 length:2175 start_codon:yes stop_codon:yes gene_type:complete
MESFVIECRNQDADISENYGDWQTNIKPLFLEEGDTIICRNSYIDTQAQSDGKILMEDTTLEFEFLSYKMNWNGIERNWSWTNPPNYTEGIWNVPPAVNTDTVSTSQINHLHYIENQTLPNIDGDPYIMCSKHVKTGGIAMWNLLFLRYGQNAEGKTVGKFYAWLVWVDQDGKVRKGQVYLPENDTALENSGEFWFNVRMNDILWQEIYPHTVPNQTIVPPGVVLKNYIQLFASTKPTSGSGGDVDWALPIDNGYSDGNDHAVLYRNTNIMKTHQLPGPDPYMPPARYDWNNLINDGGDIYKPVISKISIFVPKGNYTPQEICELVNTEMTEAKGIPVDKNFANNLLLQGVSETVNAEYNHFIQMTSVDDTDYHRGGFQVQGAAKIVGASQFVLTYKEDQNKFSFQYLHTPIYGAGDGSNSNDTEKVGWGRSQQFPSTMSNNEFVPNFTDPGNPPGPGRSPITTPGLPEKYYSISRDCGIMFTKLDPPSFWKDQLGFVVNPYITDATGVNKIPASYNPASIVTSYSILDTPPKNTTNKYEIGIVNDTIPVFNLTPKVGINMTGGYLGIASTFNKGNGAAWQNYESLPISTCYGAAGELISAIENQTSDITATSSSNISNGTTTFGYFLIEVTSKFANNYLTQSDNHSHIAAIVSRYYSKDSYTTSNSSDSIVYVHSGSSQLLSSFRCRILNSDKTLATSLGSDNTILLEIIKAPKNLKKEIKSN